MTTQANDRKLRKIATVESTPYNCAADIFIQDEHPSGQRHLIAQYGDGYSGRNDLPKAENGRREFAAAVPDDWTEQEVVNLLLWPMKNPNAPYPTWEVPARVHGSPELFRFWAGEKPR